MMALCTRTQPRRSALRSRIQSIESCPGKEEKRTRGGAGRGQPGDTAAKDLEIERLEGKLAEAHRSLQEQERLVSAYLHHCSHVQPVIWETEAKIGRGSSEGGGAGVGVPLGEGAGRAGEGKDLEWEGSRVSDAEGAHELEEESGLIGVGRVLAFSPVKAGHRAKHMPAAGEGAAVDAEPESSCWPPTSEACTASRAVRNELGDVRWGACHLPRDCVCSCNRVSS